MALSQSCGDSKESVVKKFGKFGLLRMGSAKRLTQGGGHQGVELDSRPLKGTG